MCLKRETVYQFQSNVQIHHKYLFAVDGGWGQWTEWPDCDKECNGGYHTRTRVCDNPVPAYGGSECTSDGSKESETQPCNTDPCTGR